MITRPNFHLGFNCRDLPEGADHSEVMRKISQGLGA